MKKQCKKCKELRNINYEFSSPLKNICSYCEFEEDLEEKQDD